MIAVLDTNVVLQALNLRHPYAAILQVWHARRFIWALSTDILLEYQEVVVRESGPARWQTLERLLDLAAKHGSNTQRVSPSFFFRTISADRDDDKFADCAIAAHDGVIFVIGAPNGQAMAVRAGGKGDVTATHIVWQEKKGSNVGSPVYHDGHIYFVNDSRGAALCLDAKTGAVVYEEPMLKQKRDRWYATPLLSGDRLYYVSRQSGTVVLAAKPKFEVLATNVIADDDSVSNASPAVSDGRISLRSNRFAYCFDAKK